MGGFEPWMILSAVAIAVGIAGTLLPALPGPTLVFAGIAIAAWGDGFNRIGPAILVVCAILTALAFVADYLAALLGAKKAGASKLALAGAALGTVAGIATGLVGLLFMPLLGAALGQYLDDRRAGRAMSVGFATWVGLMIGAVAKVVLVLIMVGIYAAAMFWP